MEGGDDDNTLGGFMLQKWKNMLQFISDLTAGSKIPSHIDSIGMKNWDLPRIVVFLCIYFQGKEDWVFESAAEIRAKLQKELDEHQESVEEADFQGLDTITDEQLWKVYAYYQLFLTLLNDIRDSAINKP